MTRKPNRYACFAILTAMTSNAFEEVDVNKHAAAVLEETTWKLAWSDDFAGGELDDTKWSRCERGKPDWKNTMSDDPRLLKINDGVLHLRGIVNDKKDEDPAPYLTAGINSKGKFSFLYGKVQIRARFKSAQGAWPALWMLGNERGWPANGEIDLMEHLNFDHKIYQTVHSEYTIKIDKTNTPRKGRLSDMAHPSRKVKLLAPALVFAVAATVTMRLSHGEHVMVSSTSCVYFGHTTPPPWPAGNYLRVLPRWELLRRNYAPRWLNHRWGYDIGWSVANMHTENFTAICKQRGFRWVEVERVGKDHRLTVDERIPRDWLLASPRHLPPALRRECG